MPYLLGKGPSHPGRSATRCSSCRAARAGASDTVQPKINMHMPEIIESVQLLNMYNGTVG